MPLDAWSPLESLDDDLLTLESAALLSLVAKYRIDELNAAIETWGAMQYRLRGEGDIARDVVKAFNMLNDMLRVTGLVLPSAVSRGRLTSFNRRMGELSGIVANQQGDSHSVRAAVGLLNLAIEESMASSPAISDLFCSGVLDKAWRDIRRLVNSLVSKPREIQPPELCTPTSSDWNAHDPALLGDYAPWTWGIGPMFQTLGGWDSAWLMAPGVFEDELLDRVRYWTPLAHLALGPLGWSDPAMGVARWILMGMPQTTPELSLLARVWGPSALMYFSHPQMDWIPQLPGSLGFQPRTSGSQLSRIFEERESAQIFAGCGGLHMQVHLQWQMCGEEMPENIRLPAFIETDDRQRVVLKLDAMRAWHTQLQAAGDSIAAELGNPRVEVTVIAPPLGNLGTFSRSPLTGLWHSGSHEAHMLGHSRLGGTVRQLSSTCGQATTLSIRENLSVRHTNAAAFWLAGELARRHPHYVLIADGVHGLRLVSSSGAPIRISRRAYVRVGEMEVVNAAEIFAADDKRKVVEDLEAKLGLPVRKHAAATTERTIMYRAMAHIMAITVGDKATWDFVTADPVSDGAWHLTRDSEHMAFLSSDGRVRLSQGTVNLLERYNVHSRRMTPMIGDVFGSILP